MLACEVRERRGLVELLEQVLSAEVWAVALDREPDGVGEVAAVDVPLALGRIPGIHSRCPTSPARVTERAVAERWAGPTRS